MAEEQPGVEDQGAKGTRVASSSLAISEDP